MGLENDDYNRKKRRETPDSMKPYERTNGIFNWEGYKRDMETHRGHETPDSMKPYERTNGTFNWEGYKRDMETHRGHETPDSMKPCDLLTGRFNWEEFNKDYEAFLTSSDNGETSDEIIEASRDGFYTPGGERLAEKLHVREILDELPGRQKRARKKAQQGE